MLGLSPYVQVAKYKTGGILGVGSKQMVLPFALWPDVVKCLYHIYQYGFSTKEEFLKNPEFSSSSKVIDLLLSLNMLVPIDSFDVNNRYSRNHLYYLYNDTDPASIQTKLANKHVTIIGCGGIGGMLAYFLATSGIGKLTLIDHDVIELSNLTRQILFTEADIGQKKVEILKRELLKRNSSTTIYCSDLEIKASEGLYALETTDLFVVSADAPFGLMEWINSYCVEKRQAYINVGYINDISVIGPFYIPNESACFACSVITPVYNDNSKLALMCTQINKNFKTASFPSINGVAASYVFTDIVRFLGEFGTILSLNKRVGIHSCKTEFEIQKINKNPNCVICSKIRRL